MKTIKFRAWCRDAKDKFHMEENCPVTLTTQESTDWLDGMKKYSYVQPSLCVPSRGSIVAIMQFTGLKDKNGKEIYEGDILLIPDCYTDKITEDGGPQEEFNHLAPVVFADGSFGCDINEPGDFYHRGFISFPVMENEMASVFDECEIEVIGNIYENPDLLK